MKNSSVSKAAAVVAVVSASQLACGATIVGLTVPGPGIIPPTGPSGSSYFLNAASTGGGDTNAASTISTIRGFDLNGLAGAPGVAGTVKLTGFAFAAPGAGFLAGTASSMTATFKYLGLDGLNGTADDVAVGSTEAFIISNGTAADGIGYEGAGGYYVNFGTSPSAVIDGLGENFLVTLTMTTGGSIMRFKTTSGTAVADAKFSFAGSFTPSVTIPTWTLTGGGSWGAAANWNTNVVPNAVDAVAKLGSSITGGSTVTLDGNRTVGTLSFDNANAYTVASGTGGTLTMSVATGNANMNVSVGSHFITAPVALASNTIANINTKLTVADMSGAGALTKTGTGSLVLTGNNASFTGTSTISQGSIVISNAQGLGTTVASTTVAAGSTLALSGGITVAEPISIAGGGVATDHFFAGSGNQRGALQGLTGNNTYSGAITIAASATRIGVQNGSVLNITGPISEATANSQVVIRAGTPAALGSDTSSSGVVILSNTQNAWTGSTEVYGALRLGASGVLPDGSVLSVGTNNIGDSAVDLNGYSETVAGLSNNGMTGGGIPYVTNEGNADSVLTLDNLSDRSFPGVIKNGATNKISLVKKGLFVQSLTGINTYTGTTTIEGGTLTLATTGAIDGSSVIDVQAGATLNVTTKSTTFTIGNAQTLKGKGTIAGNTIVNGNLTPGNSAGKLTWSAGNLTLGDGMPLGAGATSTFEVVGAEGAANAGITYDNITLSTSAQTLIYDGTLNIDFASAPTTPGTYDLFTFSGSAFGNFDSVNLTGAVAGPLTRISGAFTATYAGITFTFTDATGDLVLTAVPEPLTAGCVLLLAARLLGRRSRASL